MSRSLTLPLLSSGALMATYLLLRPYGDSSPDPEIAAQAFASPRWVAAHLAGAASLVAFGGLTRRLAAPSGGTGTRPSRLASAASLTGVAGAVLALPYYGAETFALQVLGRAHLADPSSGALALVEQVRNQPAALASFGVGLVSLTASGVLTALAWQQQSTPRSARWAALPLGALMALFIPQFYVPAAGRMTYGVLYLLAALGWAWQLRRGPSR